MIRFGMICSNGTLASWQAQATDAISALEGAKLVLIIEDAPPSVPRTHGAPATPSLSNRHALWKWFSSRVGRRSASSRTVVVDTRFGDVPRLLCVRGSGECSSDDSISAVRSANLDFILDFGTRYPSEEIIDVPRYGVWSFIRSEDDQCGGNSICFWAVRNSDSCIRMALQRYRGSSKGAVLREGYFGNFAHSYSTSLETTLVGIADWPAQVCRDIQRGEIRYIEDASSTDVRVLVSPTNGQVVGLMMRLASRFVRRAVINLFFRNQWNIGIAAAPIEAFLDPDARPPVQWLPKPRAGYYLADPFAVSKSALFVEKLDYRTQKGHIAVLTLDPTGSYSVPREAIKLPVHMSYPYLVKYEGEIYCVPETGEAKEIAIYMPTTFAEHWTKRATLIEGFAGVDATIFQYDSRWWLFCTEAGRFSSVVLYAWYASDLFGPWIPHPCNPLKTDVRSSRPAGTPFIHQGQLYRPAQDCSQTYGGAVVINRVLHLSPHAYKEECAAVVAPYRDSPYRDGLHTLSSLGPYTLIDGKERSFNLALLPRSIWRRLLYVLRRVFMRRLTAATENSADRDAPP